MFLIYVVLAGTGDAFHLIVSTRRRSGRDYVDCAPVKLCQFICCDLAISVEIQRKQCKPVIMVMIE